MYEPVAEEAGTVLRFNRPKVATQLFGHRQLIAQAISNLVENAIRYGGRDSEITVSVDHRGPQVEIAVADRGPGIPESRLAEAVRRFGRLDLSRSEEGAGLGLALAKAIAHLHDGKLVLQDNAPGLFAALQLPIRARGVEPPHSATDRTGDSGA
jgi:signal transduction histidine kinase